jgi:hypothetical protein
MNRDCSKPYFVLSLLETRKVSKRKALKCLCEIAMREREIFLSSVLSFYFKNLDSDYAR